MGLLKKIYFAAFYNSNFALNVAALIFLVLPLFIIKYLNDSLSRNFIFYGLAVILIYSVFYNVVYLINDVVDWEKDRSQNIYKVNIFSHTRVSRNIYLYFYSLIIIILLTFLFLFSKTLFLVSASYLIILALLSLLHSCFRNIKMITIYLERLVRLSFPFLALALALNDNLNYFLAICLCFPLVADPGLKKYISKKLKIDVRYRLPVHAAYLFLVIYLLYILGSSSLSGLLLIVVIFLAIEIFLTAAGSLLSKYFKIAAIYRYYHDEADEKNKLLVGLIMSSAIVVCLFIYANS